MKKTPFHKYCSKTMRWIFVLTVATLFTGVAGCSDSIEKTSVSGVITKVKAVIDFAQCLPCPQRYCVIICPKQAIDSVLGTKFGQPSMTFIIDTDKCIKCGHCFEICPWGAIYWQR